MEKGRQGKCPIWGKIQSIENAEKIVRCIYCTNEFIAEKKIKKKRNIKEKFAFLNKKNKHKLRKEEETKPYPDNFI